MKITFPHFGNSYIAFKAAAEAIGLDYVVPPKTSKKDIALGTKASPETICLPFKVNLGNLLQAIESGADTITYAGGVGPCRFGYYGRVQHRILRDAGFEFDSILLGREGLLAVYNKFRDTVDGNLTRAWLHAFRAFKRKAEAMDELERAARVVRPFEIARGSISRALADGLDMVHQAETLKAIDRALVGGLESIRGTELETDRGRPLQVAVLGEIYAVLEPSLNFDIERKLGEMGILSHPVMSVYKWLFRPLKTDPSILIDERRARRIARPYIAYVLGGEEHQTITGTITAARRGYDGVIHLYPFTCMPENICRTILPRIESEYDIPVLNLCLDEHASPTGVSTRLEAFSDLMRQRRGRKD